MSEIFIFWTTDSNLFLVLAVSTSHNSKSQEVNWDGDDDDDGGGDHDDNDDDDDLYLAGHFFAVVANLLCNENDSSLCDWAFLLGQDCSVNW